MDTIKLDVDFFENIKVKKLKRRFDSDGVVALINLWCWCAKYQPDGNIGWMEIEDIALASNLDEVAIRAEYFVETLAELQFLDRTPNGYKVHDWGEFNPMK